MAIITLIFLLHNRPYRHKDFNIMGRKRGSKKLFDKEKIYDRNWAWKNTMKKRETTILEVYEGNEQWTEPQQYVNI